MLISNVVVIAILVAIGSCIGINAICQSKANPTISQDSLLVDGDGNEYPVKHFADGKLWMTAYLNLNISDSYCYNDVQENCELYGRRFGDPIIYLDIGTGGL